MKVYSAELVEAEFKLQALDKVSATHDELTQGHFHSYDEFEQHQFTKRKPIWISVLVGISNCTKRSDLERQYDLFGKVFREFYSDHIEWLENPSSCPMSIKKMCEKKLTKIIELFNKAKMCHWKRDHKFVCFCKD